MSSRGVCVAILIASSACGPRYVRPRPQPILKTRNQAQPARPESVAHAAFEPRDFESVFTRAIDSVHAAGYELASCDAERGVLSTEPRELELQIDGTMVLGRTIANVVLGYRAARVSIEAEVFDTGLRAWIPAQAGALQRAADQIVTTIVPAPGAPLRPARTNPCGDLAPVRDARTPPRAAGGRSRG